MERKKQGEEGSLDADSPVHLPCSTSFQEYCRNTKSFFFQVLLTLATTFSISTYLAGMLGGPLMPGLGLKVPNSCLGKLAEGHHHGVLHQPKPVLHIASCLHRLSISKESLNAYFCNNKDKTTYIL